MRHPQSVFLRAVRPVCVIAVTTAVAVVGFGLGRQGATLPLAVASNHLAVPSSLGAPPPPQEPTLHSVDTKTTTRLYGTDPYSEAVAVTQHLWPAALPANAPGENDNVPDRPWGITLVTADDPLTAITATPLIHFPDDAPILYVTRSGIPQVTLDEIKRLGDTGISRNHNVDAIVVGAAANPGVLHQLDQLHLKHDQITANNVYDLANKVDQYYGRVQNPDTGVAVMGGTSSSGGNGTMDVMIGSTSSYQFVLPATHWVSHMATGLLWVTKDSVPGPTLEALKRRGGMAHIYLFGGPDQISPKVARQLSRYGTVSRESNDDEVAFNAPPKDNPIDTSIAFAKSWDPAGMVGWNITGPGHGFTLVNIHDWQGAVASAPLSHLGMHAPLLLTDSPTALPSSVDGYYRGVAPTFLASPADGPYNMSYIVGDYGKISWPEQAHVDFISEMSNRRVSGNNSGSLYNSLLH